MFGLIKSFFNLVFAYKQQESDGKKPWQSKTFWTLLVAWVGLILSKYAGITLSAEEQTTIIGVLALFLRLISKDSVGFYEDKG
jgi:hypothetical protein